MKGHPFPDLLRTTTQTGTAARAEQGRWSVRDARLVLIALGIPEERLQQQCMYICVCDIMISEMAEHFIGKEVS